MFLPRLGRFPVKCIHLLAPNVADDEKRIVGGETAPGSDEQESSPKAFQADEPLYSAIVDSYAIVGGVIPEGIEIEILPVPRPGEEINAAIGQLCPLLRAEVEEHQC